MSASIRRHYVDNIRWIILLILIPYHTAQAWNVWGEPNYIFFEGNRAISSIIVFFSPYFMPLLFLLAGISTKFALQKRTIKEYLIERVKKLLIPLVFGTIILMPIMVYIGDKFNYSYNKGFFEHYYVFFTKYTDLTGADGGFSFGQFWFLLYLLLISVLSVGVIFLLKKIGLKSKKKIPFWLCIAMGIPLPIFSELLSIGGKSFVEYTYFFLLGYFIFSDDEIISKVEKKMCILSIIGIIFTILNVYLFIWSDNEYILLNTISKFVSKWFMVIAWIAFAKRFLNFSGKVSCFMSKRSFLFYIWHFIWVVVLQYLIYMLVGNQTVILFTGTIIFSYFMTFICAEISIRIRFLCFLTGTKYNSHTSSHRTEGR